MGVKVFQDGYLVDSDLLALDRQARDGDAVSGWRGDPSMWVNYDPQAGEVQVFGRDLHNKPYLAAACHKSTPDWRNVLLHKLVKGDWQHRAGNLVEETMAANAKVRENAEQQYRDYVREELAPKLHWAFVKDGEAIRTDFYMTPRGKRKDKSA